MHRKRFAQQSSFSCEQNSKLFVFRKKKSLTYTNMKAHKPDIDNALSLDVVENIASHQPGAIPNRCVSKMFQNVYSRDMTSYFGPENVNQHTNRLVFTQSNLHTLTQKLLHLHTRFPVKRLPTECDQTVWRQNDANTQKCAFLRAACTGHLNLFLEHAPSNSPAEHRNLFSSLTSLSIQLDTSEQRIRYPVHAALDDVRMRPFFTRMLPPDYIPNVSSLTIHDLIAGHMHIINTWIMTQPLKTNLKILRLYNFVNSRSTSEQQDEFHRRFTNSQLSHIDSICNPCNKMNIEFFNDVPLEQKVYDADYMNLYTFAILTSVINHRNNIHTIRIRNGNIGSKFQFSIQQGNDINTIGVDQVVRSKRDQLGSDHIYFSNFIESIAKSTCKLESFTFNTCLGMFHLTGSNGLKGLNEFVGNKNLTFLDLSHNNFQWNTLSSQTSPLNTFFKHATHLNTLCLNNCNISNIPFFNSQPNFTRFEISHNNLSHLEFKNGLFQLCIQNTLTDLDVSHCHLAHAFCDALVQNTSLQKLSVHENPNLKSIVHCIRGNALHGMNYREISLGLPLDFEALYPYVEIAQLTKFSIVCQPSMEQNTNPKKSIKTFTLEHMYNCLLSLSQNKTITHVNMSNLLGYNVYSDYGVDGLGEGGEFLEFEEDQEGHQMGLEIMQIVSEILHASNDLLNNFVRIDISYNLIKLDIFDAFLELCPQECNVELFLSTCTDDSKLKSYMKNIDMELE